MEMGVGRKQGGDPVPGDLVVFFYAQSGCDEPGFYGWAVILSWSTEHREISFRPVTPSDQLKMRPWDDETAMTLAHRIRGKVKQGTLWPVTKDHAREVGEGFAAWTQGTLSRRDRSGMPDAGYHSSRVAFAKT